MIYTIKKGNQSSGLHLNPWPLFYKRTEQNFKFKFHENCLTNDPNARKGWGKFGGFSQGLHQKNSYRFGWMPQDDRILVTYYVHQEGSLFYSDSLTSVEVNKTYKANITRLKEHIEFCIENVLLEFIPLICNPVKYGYLLGFYYGGGSTGPAPQNMSVEVL
jgi:hypothetical protein